MSAVCQTCRKPKATLTCGACSEDVCKNCAQFLAEDAFSFLPEVAPELKHQVYCGVCYDRVVAPFRENYEKAMDAAREIQVFFKDQGKETRFIRRIEKPVKVRDCVDRDEALLRLAFFAVQAGYNGLIDVDLKSEKVRIDSYQTLKWSGSGIPATVNSKQLMRDRSLWSNPN